MLVGHDFPVAAGLLVLLVLELGVEVLEYLAVAVLVKPYLIYTQLMLYFTMLSSEQVLSYCLLLI